MISRDRLARWLVDRFTPVVQPTDRPALVSIAEAFAEEATEKWLESEAQFWLSASQKKGLTLQQRQLRINVARFYENRLIALRSGTEPSRVRDTTEGGSTP